MTSLTSYHCDLCRYDVPGFLWPIHEAPGSAGGHFVMVDGPIKVEHDQPRDYFERNVIRVLVSMTVRPMQCRDVERSGRAGDPGDEGSDRGRAGNARAGGTPPDGA